MKTLILFACLISCSVRASVMASNIVNDVCSYTGSVVTVQGVVDSVKRDGIASASYVVVMQGLNVRIFFNPNSKIPCSDGHYKRLTYDLITKPKVGSFGVFTGVIKIEMGKPFLITPKKD